MSCCSINRSKSACWIVLLLTVMCPVRLPGQGRTSTIGGEIRDPRGDPIPGAHIAIRNRLTGIVRLLDADSQGRYRAAFLDPGEYRVEVSADGFVPDAAPDVTLFVDHEAELTHRLTVAGPAESVEVTASAADRDASASALSTVIEGKQIREIPLNGRDYVELATLSANTAVAVAQARNDNTGEGIQISVAGSRPVQNNFRLDGISISSYTGSTPGSALGLNLGVDAIEEFSVVASAASAEYGRSAGGIINAISRSGTNEYHGSVSHFLRNDRLDARNFFDSGAPPPFRRNQFGASAGGPIQRNRMFFFVNYEGIRQVQGNTTIDTTLSDAARSGHLSGGDVPVSSTVAPLLALYPRPNSALLGDTGLYIFSNNTAANEDFATIRFDEEAKARDRVFLRYSLDQAVMKNETDFGVDRSRNATDQLSAVAAETHIFSQSLVNSFRSALVRFYGVTNQTQAQSALASDPNYAFLPHAAGLGSIVVPGLTTFPGGTGGPDSDRDAFTSIQIYDDLAWAVGRHWFRGGGSIERTRFNIDSSSNRNGQYNFASVAAFLQNNPLSFQAQLPGSDTIRGFRQWIPAWYLQDRWTISSRVTVDLGVRHEWATVPAEVNGKISNLDQVTSPAMRIGGPLFDNPSFRNLAPRAGIAWDVRGSGRTVVRAGYGISYDLLLSQFLLLAELRNPPFFLAGTVRHLPSGDFPLGGYNSLITGGTAQYRAERIPRDLRQPYVQQWNFNIEQRTGQNAALTLAYSGSHGLHLSDIIEDANLATPEVLADGQLFFPAGAPKANPHFSMIRDREFDGQSFYHALVAEWRRLWRHGVEFQSSYRFSKSIDDNSDTFAATEADNGIGSPIDGNHKINRGLSNFDVRHQVIVNGIWEIPGPRAAMLRPVLSHWHVSSLASWSTGVPFSVTLGYDAARTGTSRADYRGGQRPDLVPGFSNDPVTGNPNGWFDVSAFSRPAPGFLGNLGRNTLTGPSRTTIDLALVRSFAVPGMNEKAHLDVRLEGFNVPNYANFNIPDQQRTQIFTAASVIEDAGRITSAAPARELQLSLRLIF
ncbi:MAG TPA: carboxypeptidase regulatory-like domain-containing protein [Bryobacteraceae bacterium]|nr:carboxypeptidase regulatory-like domain-containing protein [Bryobacteraceae bacterium]